MIRYRPIARTDRPRPQGAEPLAGGLVWCDQVEPMEKGVRHALIPLREVPAPLIDRIIAPRPKLAGLTLNRPRLMGVLNVTPDSFSDGGRFTGREAAIAHAAQMQRDGADILDVGGESTRPGAAIIPEDEEIARVAPVIDALRDAGVPISVDTRKAAVAQAALEAGAAMLNDVSALGFDPKMVEVAARSGAPVCLMHAQGDPATMQKNPSYEDVLLDVYDYLEQRVLVAEASGIPRAHIVLDPGIGFGKTKEHNLTLIRGLSLFHGLGCPILLGVSRKRFIGDIGRQDRADLRTPGSIAVGLEGLRQGVQLLRVHDIEPHRQAIELWCALNGPA